MLDLPLGMGSSLAARGLEIRRITDASSLHSALALRFQVLCAEQGYCHASVREPQQMLDAYDESSHQVGVFHADRLVGAARLVDGRGDAGLPSVPLLRAAGVPELKEMVTGEIGRVVVARDWRGRGLYVQLLVSCFILARESGLNALLISERTKPSFAKQLRRFGFVSVLDEYWFHDQRIEPRVLTTTYLVSPIASPERYQALLGP